MGIHVSFIIISLLRWSHWKTTAHLQIASSGSVGYFAASRVRACLRWVGTAEQFSGLYWPGLVLKMLTESVWTMLLSWLVPAHCSLDTKRGFAQVGATVQDVKTVVSLLLAVLFYGSYSLHAGVCLVSGASNICHSAWLAPAPPPPCGRAWGRSCWCLCFFRADLHWMHAHLLLLLIISPSHRQHACVIMSHAARKIADCRYYR